MIVVAHTGRWRTPYGTPLYVGGSDRDYFDLLASMWATGESFTVIEHDIVATRQTLTSLEDCGHGWCAARYRYVAEEGRAGLGCTRFDRELIARHPDLLDVVATMSDRLHPPMHWCRLDAWITNTLTARGEVRCENHGTVEHVMADPERSTHGCYTIRGAL